MTVTRNGRPPAVRRGSLPVVCETFAESLDRKSRRTKYTGNQRDVLEQVYNGDMYPSTTFKRELAGFLQLTNKQVQIWFQNRRSKDKLEAAAAGMPPPTRRRNSNARPPMTPISSSSSSSFQRSYTDGSLHTLSSSSSRPNLRLSASPTKGGSTGTTPYPKFPLLPPADLVSQDRAIVEPISEEILAGLQPFPGTSPTYGPATPAPMPATPAASVGVVTPASALQRTSSMPAPMSLPTVRPSPRRHATSGLLQETRAMRPPMLSFQSFNMDHRLSGPLSAPDVRPSTSAGFAPHAPHDADLDINDHRPITSAGLVTISHESRAATPPAMISAASLASPIAIRNTPSGISLTKPPSPPVFDLFAHRGLPSPTESEEPSPAPSEWSSVGSYSRDYEFTNLQASSMPNLPLPHTPLQMPTVPMSHFAAFSPTSTASSSASPLGGVPPHSFSSGFIFDHELGFDPSALSSLEEPAFGVPDLPMTMTLPGGEVDFEHLMEDLTTPSASRANIPPDWSSAFAHIAIQDEHQHSSNPNAFLTHDMIDSHHSMIPAEQTAGSTF